MGKATPSVTTSGYEHSLNATVTWGSGPEVTVEVNSTTSWRLVTKGNSNEVHLSSSYATDGYTDTFEATDGGEYIFQIYYAVEGSYFNNDFDTSGFTVNFDDDSGGSGDGGDGGDTSETYYLTIEQGEGTEVIIERVYSSEGVMLGRIYNGDAISFEDELTITVNADDGYELDWHTNEYNNDSKPGQTYDAPFAVSNLRKNISQETYSVLGNVTIITTATPVATVRVYDGSGWNKYAPYIYSGSSWDRYTPYIYDGSS